VHLVGGDDLLGGDVGEPEVADLALGDERRHRRDGLRDRDGGIGEVQVMLEQVADGSAYCIVPASMTQYYARPDLVWIPIADVDPLRIALAWRERDRSPLVAAFAAVVHEVAADG
jgi:DNA-binding transcriptional LysR family regulator